MQVLKPIVVTNRNGVYSVPCRWEPRTMPAVFDNDPAKCFGPMNYFVPVIDPNGPSRKLLFDLIEMVELLKSQGYFIRKINVRCAK